MIDAGFQEVVMNLRLNFKFPLKSCCNAAEGWRHGAETFLKQPETSASLPAHVPSLAPGLVPAPFLAGDSPHPHSSPLKRGKPFPWPKASSCTARAGRHGALGAPAGAQARRRTCHASAGTSAGASTRTSTRTSAGRCRGRLMFLNRVKLFRKCFSSVSALLLSPSWDAAPGRAACGCRLVRQADEGWARAADQGKSCVSTQSEPRAAKDAQRSVAKTSCDDLSQEGLPGALRRAVRRSSCMSGMVFAFRHFAFHHFRSCFILQSMQRRR